MGLFRWKLGRRFGQRFGQRFGRHLGAIAWSSFILLLCTLPSKALPQPSLLGLDKLVHFALFAVFAGLWCWAEPRRRRGIWLAGVLFALFTEIAQAYLSSRFGIERSADWADAWADILGLSLTLLWLRPKTPLP